MSAKRERKAGSSRAMPDRESGQPGGGRGRTDEVGHTGVYPGSGPYPPGEAAVRTPESFVHGQRDAEGRQVEGGSEPIHYNHETLLGGATPPSSSPPSPEAKGQPGGSGADRSRRRGGSQT
jgi:hypothetical protein